MLVKFFFSVVAFLLHTLIVYYFNYTHFLLGLAFFLTSFIIAYSIYYNIIGLNFFYSIFTLILLAVWIYWNIDFSWIESNFIYHMLYYLYWDLYTSDIYRTYFYM